VLKYLVDSTIQLSAMMIVVGMIHGYVRNAYGEKTGKRMLISICAGIAGAIAMAVMKTATNKIDTGTWNLWFYFVSCGSFLLFLIFTALGKILKSAGKILVFILLSFITVIQMVYALADYLVYPHTMMLTEETVVSSVFLTKLSGMLTGLILVIVTCIAANAVIKSLKKPEAMLFVSLAVFVTSFRQVSSAVSILLARRLIPNNHTLFQIAKFSSNNNSLFIYITLGIAVFAAVILLLRSLHVDEPYTNPAQHRKIIYKWRMIRRWSFTLIICAALTVFIMTAVYAIANKEVELSPIEECQTDEENMYIPFELVNDGHLHRFGYTTEKGTVIRVIVIQKPNSSAYGVGLDACDICGETGYYEKDGQVVCNLCDVVMNINTIGFKGGCNPIVIDYRIENGRIIIPIEGLLEYENEFK